jgi:hypothetical protein
MSVETLQHATIDFSDRLLILSSMRSEFSSMRSEFSGMRSEFNLERLFCLILYFNAQIINIKMDRIFNYNRKTDLFEDSCLI